MIKIKNINFMRGGNPLFINASLTIHYGQHIGLTGANGCGKSSLFSLILNEIQPDAGEIYVPSSQGIAHMAQEVEALNQPAIEYVLDGDSDLRSIEKSIRQAEDQHDNNALALLYDQFANHNGYTARARAEKLLHGLGFVQHELEHFVSTFSGGWRMRLNLARTLMCPSDIMLLDEPTNHLDLDAIFWLENWLKQYPGTLIFISHDQIFLDNVATHIAHIEQEKITLYTGNYTAFERARIEKLALQQADYEKQQKQKEHLQKFITRFKAKATKASQAQSRVKALAKMEELAPAYVHSPFNFSFRTSEKISDPLLSINKGDIGYNKKPLLSNVNISFHPASRIGLLGANGAGKSTLIKVLAGEPLLSGHVSKGEHLTIGYFSQHQLENLDMEASPFLHIQRLSFMEREQVILNYLGGFDFHRDKALAPVKGFSGGERARLALAIIAWQKPNLLLLDEPTNHLDLEMRHALTMALQSYEGAVVLVSHDRALINAVANELWLVRDGAVSPFEGDLDAYAQWLKNREKFDRVSAMEKSTDTKNPSRKEQRQMDAQSRKRLQTRKKMISSLEKEMHQKQKEQNKIEAILTDASLYEEGERDRLQVVLQEQASLEQDLKRLEEEWLNACEELESAALRAN